MTSTDTARRHYFEHKRTPGADKSSIESYERMLDFQAQCEKSSIAFTRDWENIEELYTQADLRRMAGIPTAEEGSKLCQSIAWAIWDVYRRGIGPDPEQMPMAYLHRALTALRTKERLQATIVTTNYDLVVENAIAPYIPYHYPGLEPLKGEARDPLGCIAESVVPANYEDGSTAIIKLHGSVNWFKVGDKHIASRMIENRNDRQGISHPSRTQQVVSTEIGRALEHRAWPEITPMIIPPMLGKAAVGSLISKQWNAAIDALRSARYLVVMGYSFPETDAFMTRLLSEALQANDHLHSVVLVDIAPIDSWKPKCQRMFSPVFLRKKVYYVEAQARSAVLDLLVGSMDDLLKKGRRLA